MSNVFLDECHGGAVELARLTELHRRDAQPLGVDTCRLRGVGAGDAATDVGVVETVAAKATRSLPR
jgi:hypothetical protein